MFGPFAISVPVLQMRASVLKNLKDMRCKVEAGTLGPISWYLPSWCEAPSLRGLSLNFTGGTYLYLQARTLCSKVHALHLDTSCTVCRASSCSGQGEEA